MGNCCYCCLGEGEKVARVLRKFQAHTVSQAVDGALQKLVGRVVIAGQTPFYTPADGQPCVWYRVTVEEERIEEYTVHDTRQNEDGTQTRTERREKRNVWHNIATEEKFCDFYLQDGVSKIFVNGSNRGTCRIQGDVNSGRAGMTIFRAPPPGIQRLIFESNSGFDWGHSGHRTGQFRYSQASFNVNEILTCLGVVAPSTDMYTGQPCKALMPINDNVLTEDFFKNNKWEEWDVLSWKDLVEKSPSVLISDSDEFRTGVVVQPIPNLPQWMLVPVVVAAPMAAPMMMQQPMMQQPMMQQPMMQQPMMQQPMMQQPMMQQPMMQQPMMMQGQQPMMMQGQQPMMMQPQ